METNNPRCAVQGITVINGPSSSTWRRNAVAQAIRNELRGAPSTWSAAALAAVFLASVTLAFAFGLIALSTHDITAYRLLGVSIISALCAWGLGSQK